MPIVPSGNGSPFVMVGDVFNTARQRVLDMHNDVNGDLLTNDAPYAQTILTDSWTWIQDQCADAGIEVNTKEVTLYGIPARGTQDITRQAWVTWQGCSDGILEYSAPALPYDVIMPFDVWRRATGAVGTNGQLVQMRQGENGLPRFYDPDVYDWRENGLYFYGSQYAQDMLIRYAAYFEDLSALRPTQAVPIRGCKECLGARMAFLFTNARYPGSAGAQSLEAMANKAFADSLGTRTSKRKQRITVRRRPFSRRGSIGAAPFPYVIN